MGASWKMPSKSRRATLKSGDRSRSTFSISIWTYYLFGLVMWIVAVPVALTRKDIRPRCPECAENVKPEARICPHCQSQIEGRIIVQQPKQIERIL